jgi:predicted ester cyclase
MKRAGAGVSDPRFEIHDLIAEGDRVAARLTSSARHTGTFMGLEPSGNRYTIDEIHIFRIRNGQLSEHWHAFDTMTLMRQLRGEGDGPSADGAAVGRPDRQRPQGSVAR